MRPAGTLALLVVCDVFASGAAATAPPVVAHTYKVVYLLKGHYHQATSYTDGNADGYCGGTGYTEDANFIVTAGGRIRVKLSSGTVVGAPALANIQPGTWTLHGHVVASGDPCDRLHQEVCNGNVEYPSGAAHPHLVVVGRGHQLGFGVTTSVPHEVLESSDCDATADYAPPPPENSLQAALEPYASVGLAVPIATLGAKKLVRGVAKPVNVPSDYSLATCNHTDGCTATITGLTSTITITQVG